MAAADVAHGPRPTEEQIRLSQLSRRGLSDGAVRERIAQVVECVRANEDRVLDILHMHNYDVQKTISAFLDGDASKVVEGWEENTPRKKGKRKDQSQPAKPQSTVGDDSQSKRPAPATVGVDGKSAPRSPQRALATKPAPMRRPQRAVATVKRPMRSEAAPAAGMANEPTKKPANAKAGRPLANENAQVVPDVHNAEAVGSAESKADSRRRNRGGRREREKRERLAAKAGQQATPSGEAAEPAPLMSQSEVAKAASVSSETSPAVSKRTRRPRRERANEEAKDHSANEGEATPAVDNAQPTSLPANDMFEAASTAPPMDAQPNAAGANDRAPMQPKRYVRVGRSGTPLERVVLPMTSEGTVEEIGQGLPIAFGVTMEAEEEAFVKDSAPAMPDVPEAANEEEASMACHETVAMGGHRMSDAAWAMGPVPQVVAPAVASEAVPENQAVQVPFYPPWEMVCTRTPEPLPVVGLPKTADTYTIAVKMAHGGYGAEIDPYAGYYQPPHQMHGPMIYGYPPFDMLDPQQLGPFFEPVSSRAPGSREERRHDKAHYGNSATGPQHHSPRMGHHGSAGTTMATHKQQPGEYSGMHVYSAPMGGPVPVANGNPGNAAPANTQHNRGSPHHAFPPAPNGLHDNGQARQAGYYPGPPPPHFPYGGPGVYGQPMYPPPYMSNMAARMQGPPQRLNAPSPNQMNAYGPGSIGVQEDEVYAQPQQSQRHHRNERRNYRANSSKSHGDYHGNQRTASPPPAQVPYGMPMLHVPMY